MLILTRRVSETILLTLPTGEEIKIMVVAFKGDGVRLGFTAPREVEILRSELIEAKTGVDP